MQHHRLQAIVFTDLQGFSARMSVDEERTIELVKEHRELVRAHLGKHSGREKETTGDGFVLLFDSAVDAVRFGLSVQTASAERNLRVPEADRLNMRIGVHLGDVVLEERDAFGHSMNLAARVEPLAPPGGLCITEPVFRAVEKRVDATFQAMGVVPLKNIAEPPAVWRVVPPGVPLPPLPAGPKAGSPSRRRVLAGSVTALALGAAGFGLWRLRGPGPQPTEVVSADPWVQERWTEARTAFLAGEMTRARRTCTAILEEHPDLAMVRVLRALARDFDDSQRLRDLEQASRDVESRDDPAARLIRLVDRAVVDREPVIDEARQWLQSWPDDPLAYPLLADVMGPNTEVEQVLADGQARFPGVAVLAWLRAAFLYHSDRPDEADEAAEDAIRRFPESAGPWTVWAKVALSQGDPELARKRWREALRRDPSLVSARMDLAMADLFLDEREDEALQIGVLLGAETPIEPKVDFAAVHVERLGWFGRLSEARALADQGDAIAAAELQTDARVDVALSLASAILQCGRPDTFENALAVVNGRLADPGVSAGSRDEATLRLLGLQLFDAWLRRSRDDLDTLATRAAQLDRPGTGRLAAIGRARIAVLDRDLPRALASLETVDDGIEPIRGDLQIAAGDLEGARATLERWLRAGPSGRRNPATVARLALELAELAATRGHEALRTLGIETFRRAWPGPDPDLPYVVRLQALVNPP